MAISSTRPVRGAALEESSGRRVKLNGTRAANECHNSHICEAIRLLMNLTSGGCEPLREVGSGGDAIAVAHFVGSGLKGEAPEYVE